MAMVEAPRGGPVGIVEHPVELGPVDPMMPAKLPVLGHHHCRDQGRRDLLERHPLPIDRAAEDSMVDHQRRDRRDEGVDRGQDQRDGDEDDRDSLGDTEKPAPLRMRRCGAPLPLLSLGHPLGNTGWRGTAQSPSLTPKLDAKLDGWPLSPQSGAVTETFQTRLKTIVDATEATLDRLLSADVRPGEIARPERLLAAMRHGALGAGKRLRPFLLVESARLLGETGAAVIEAAAALECVHCYSLVHDDLPAMDDDDLRRGQPTVHKAFDEATAILAGDALLTLAFDCLAGLDADAAVRIELVGTMARAAGIGGMAGGQMLDIAAEGTTPDEATVLRLQAMKTGALIRYACEAGAILAHASAEDRAKLVTFGERIGQAFQLADDLIDATGDPAAAGKATAKDAARGKATLVALHGVDRARALLDEKVADAVRTLAPFGERGKILADAARFIGARQS
jgi:farnesyl diphosphate synthase